MKRDQDVRNQEVLRATKELAAYFKGQRTEREARSALKIIKGFIREREAMAPGNRPPLPGRRSAPAVPAPKPKRRVAAGRRTRAKASPPVVPPAAGDQSDG